MKKFLVCFILLFTFLVFIPQVALADSVYIYPPSEKQIQEDKDRQSEELKCLYQKKSKLSPKYTGHNLRLEEIPYIDPYYSGLGQHPYTENKYYTSDKKGTIMYGASFVSNCEEYIFIMYKNYKKNINPYRKYIGITPLGVNVTNVPPNYYLKYIPKANEIEVLATTEELRKELLTVQSKQRAEHYKRWEQEEKLNQTRKKQKEEICLILKHIAFPIFAVLFVFAIIMILIKKIRKK